MSLFSFDVHGRTINKKAGKLVIIGALCLWSISANADWKSSRNSWNTSGDSSSSTSRLRDVSPFAPGSNNISLDLGQIFLMGSLNDQYADSLGTRIHYTYGVSDIFAFDSSLGFSEHSDSRFGLTTLLTGLRTNLSWYDKAIPYTVFGLGFFRPSYSISTTEEVADVLFGLHLGAGVDLQITNQIFFGAALGFHSMFGTERVTSKGVMDIGGTFTSLLVRTGVTF